MVKKILLPVLALLFCSSLLCDAQIKIIRRGDKNGPAIDDMFDVPELASMLALEKGKVVVETVLDKKMRPKEYESVDIQEGDVVMMVNGKKIKTLDDLKTEYGFAAVGSAIKLGVQRKEDMMIVSFDKADPSKLPQRKMMIRKGGDADADDIMIIPNTGLLIGGKGPKVFVDKVLTDVPSSLKDADVKEGDVVTAVNGKKVDSWKEFSETYKKIAVGDNVSISTSRKGTALSFSFKKAEGGQQRVIERKQ